VYARSVSWSMSGNILAMASSDRMTRLFTLADGAAAASTTNGGSVAAAREILTLAGHTGPVDRVRFHPFQESLLCTTASDGSVRLWDVRASSPQKGMGRLDLAAGGSACDIAWSPKPGILAVTERSGTVNVIDVRRLSSNQTWTTTPASNAPGGGGGKSSSSAFSSPVSSPILKTFSLRPSFVDGCIFSPSGHHLVAATSSEGYGELTIWNWEEKESHQPHPELGEEQNTDPNSSDKNTTSKLFVYPAHTGPIYSVMFSPSGKRLATGGGDALVGLWDVDSMVCTTTITRCTRFVRSVSFSHDSQVLATSTEDDGVDLAMAETGALIGKLSLSGAGTGRNRVGDRNAGADEIAFHPKTSILACARCDSGLHAPLTIAKLTFVQQ
jgi:THO complex subunit 3